MATAIPVSEREWQAESDARTLAEAAVIKKDKKRVGAAKKKAKKMAVEKKQEAVAMAQVARKAPKKNARKKVTRKGK